MYRGTFPLSNLLGPTYSWWYQDKNPALDTGAKQALGLGKPAPAVSPAYPATVVSSRQHAPAPAEALAQPLAAETMKPLAVVPTQPPAVATAQPPTAVPASAPAKDPKKNKFKMNLMSSLNFGVPAAGTVTKPMLCGLF